MRAVARLSAMTPRELERYKRHASFLPPGSNIHRSRNLYLPDSATDPFAALVTFLAHFDTTFDSVLGTVGTPLGGVPPVLGPPPQFGAAALSFASGVGRVSYPGAGILFGNGALTIEGWVRPGTLGGGSTRYIMGTSLIGGSFFLYILNFNADGAFRYNLRGGEVNTGVVPPLNVYTSFAVSLAAGTPANGARFFVNGAVVNTGTANAGNGGSPATFAMGDGVGPGLQGMAGQLDEVRFTLAQRYTAAYTPTGPFPNP